MHAYLRIVFSEHRLQYFDKHHVSIEPSFLIFLRRAVSTAAKVDEHTLYLSQIDEYANTPTVRISDLPEYVAQALENPTVKKSISSHIALLIKKSLLAAEKNALSNRDRSELQAVRDVLTRFGWAANREEFVSQLDDNGVVALQKQLNEVLSDADLHSTPDVSMDDTPATIVKYADTSRKRSFVYRYCDWAVDRPLASTDQPIKRLIDILRHRLDIKLFSSVGGSAQTGSTSKALARNLLQKATLPKPPALNTNSVYDALIQLVTSSDVLSQMELFRLLLERRSLVPLLTPRKSERPFSYHIKPLTFVNVKLTSDSGCNLSSDTSLFRVAVISMRSIRESESRELLKQVFGCHSLGHLVCLTDNHPVAELGVGFCPKVDDDHSFASPDNEVLVLHIIGDYTSLFSYIHTFADLFLVESHSDSSVQYQLPIPVDDSKKVIIWKSATSEAEPYTSEEDYIHIQSTIAQALSHIHAIIDTLIEKTVDRRRVSLQDMAHSALYDVDSINWINVEDELKKQDFFQLRTAELQLQQLFVKEAEHLRQKIQAQTTFAERETAEHSIRECRRRREQLAPTMFNHPLLKCFLGVLSQHDQQVRTVGICQYVKHLEFYSKHALQELFLNQERAHADFNSHSQNKEKRDAYYEAKRVYAGSLVTIEHLWRELAHIYVSNPKRYTELPMLAARHLLDGFSLELLDGDAGMLEQSWINAVFHHLNELLAATVSRSESKSARLLVLSVMGVQSSGKSTLLNLMFGTRLRASAGMCTRGVNIQLLKAEDRLEYDYVLILDTEGVRAPEFSGLQGATWRDNRLATFSILPADVTIIMINNEEDTAAREVLPIVMLAYQQSELAARSTNQLKTKLIFVYTRIDTNEKNKLSGIAQSLCLELRKVAADLEQSQRHSTDHQSFTSELLHDFRTEDIQFLGKLKVRDRPPEDIPEFDYGYDIIKLNGYIHDRLMKSSPCWQPRPFRKFAEYLDAIWQCVQTVDFTLSFRTVLERWAYEALQGYCRDMYGKLASLYSSEYDKLEPIILKTLDDSSLTTADCDKMIDKFHATFEATVRETTDDLHREFKCHVDHQKVSSVGRRMTLFDVRSVFQHWQSWSVDTKRGWHFFAEKQTTDVMFRIRQLITNRLMFDQEFTKYQKTLRDNISASFQDKDQDERENLAGDQTRQLSEFEEIFNAILHSVNKQHPVINVEVEILRVYDLNGIGKDFDFTQKHREMKSTGKSKPVGTNRNIVCSLWKGVMDLFAKSSAQKADEETRFLFELQSYIDNLLKPVKRYIDHVPTEAIQITERKLIEYKIKRDELRKRAHQVIYAQLVIQLEMIQNKWEQVHSIAVRLNQARDTMWEYYQKTVQGIHGIKLLTSEVIAVFERHRHDGYREVLQPRVITELTHESWIGNDQIVQAMLSLELIRRIRNDEIEQVIRTLSNMGEHYSNIVEELLRKKIEHLAHECARVYHELLRYAIQAAISDTANYQNPMCDEKEADLAIVCRGRTDLFLRALSRNLLEHRLARFSDDINALNVASLSICDSEEDEVWNQVRDEIIDKIPSNLPDDYLLPGNVDELVKSIRDSLVNRFARGGVTLRCSEPCPLCGSPCRAAAGHTMDPAEDKRRHDADHQPSGLFGTYQIEDRQLVPDSCSTNMRRNFTFAYSSAQDHRPYSEFSICFPEWKQPPPLATSTNEVGQHVFYHYQKELAKYHKCKRCTKIPPSFDRSLDELKRKQENIINGIILE